MDQLELFSPQVDIDSKFDWLDLESVTIDDMPNDDMKFIAERCGISFAVKLLIDCGGLNLNIPKNGLNLLKAKYIKENFNGFNLKRLVTQLDISESFVRKVIRR